MKSSFTLAALTASLALITPATATCDPSTLNTTTYYYPITEANTTVFDVARITKRGVCDIGRQNLMADVTIPPNVGETFIIPAEVCDPDNTSCLLSGNATNTCIVGGPRLYYTVNGDTYEKIALRLNITVDALMGDMGEGTTATDELPVGQFIKVPLCEDTTCVIKPYSFTWGVYKDLAEEFGTTVGQIMMLSATYNYSSLAFSAGGTFPPINILMNCTQPGKNVTVLD
ncbi:hypothetical protein BDV41DRAFT_584318 [Aspergillus transmontanensis]|uniref:LysM domain-containing protein n=1 Tax=Aspergillus transmontanensis TaxID=1034304 RepID=A0A5N6W999_9EURO|nr:hypothetical protein BDV41DRAFT_585777 [Aspergillus transmontanensis]KAE8317435.1 hypothetical protein BDV41DRAFT_584318 [Aspergillus transmontanensis]